MICSSSCKACTAKEDHGILLGMPSVPTSVKANEMFSISFTVTNSSLLADGYVYACLTDIDNGTCVYSSDLTFVQFAGGQVTFGPWQIQMPSSDYHLKLSIIESIGLLGLVCDDFLDFTVKVIAQPGQGYVCNNITKTCEGSTVSTKTLDQCNKECGASTGTGTKVVCDPANDINFMGLCVPRPVALGAFVLGAILIYKSVK